LEFGVAVGFYQVFGADCFMDFSGFTPATGRVCRLALVALTVAVAGGLQAAEKWYVSDALGTTVARFLGRFGGDHLCGRCGGAMGHAHAQLSV
jgi:hypothetical protein